MTEYRARTTTRLVSETKEGRADLLRMINGFKISQAIYVAATLKIADVLSTGPQSILDIAVATHTEPSALYRLMRMVAAVGVFNEDTDRKFSLTPMGEFLRCDVPSSLAFMAQMSGRSSVWQAWANLLHVIQTGDTAFEYVNGRSIWDFRRIHPEEGVVFDRAMALGTERYAQAVMDSYNFGEFKTIVDVGGGDGAFLGAVLARYPHMRGMLFDQPHVIAKKSNLIESIDISDRYSIIGGNFFVSVPDQADAYLLKWILHDWDDAAAIDILQTCRKAMKPFGKVIAIEHVLEPPNTGVEGKLLDLTMMVMNGGRERTKEEFAILFEKAGFRITSVVKSATELSLIEAVLQGE